MSTGMNTGEQNFDSGYVQKKNYWNFEFSWENPKSIFYSTELNIDRPEENDDSMTIWLTSAPPARNTYISNR